MVAQLQKSIWLYEAFVPGETSEELDLLVQSVDMAQWQQIYRPAVSDQPHIPAGLQVAIMMKAYSRAFQPRPSGNIHARQTIRFGGRKAAIGDTLHATVSCQRKEIKKNRRWITFEVVLQSGSAVCLTGELTTIWAA